jgi:hypothetical protein
MQSFSHQGQLTTWKDDRGFGFIKPDDGSKEVFRPIVGDTIFYEKVTEENGKIPASKASIQGVLNQRKDSKQSSHNSIQTANKQSTDNRINSNTQTNKRGMRKVVQSVLPVVFLIGLGISSISPVTNFVRGCNIKGNISVDTGSKLYHLPSMEDYDITHINLIKGERWFCSESEAIASGWRKAPK